jgi:hypothetical protein
MATARGIADGVSTAVVEFQTERPIPEVVARLRALSGTPGIQWDRQIVGYIDESKVVLLRSSSAQANAFATAFYGVLTSRHGQTILAGYFGFRPGIRRVLTVWFAFAGAWIIATSVLAVRSPDPMSWVLPAAGVAVILGGLTVLAIGKVARRDDIAWLSEFLRGTL